MSDGSGSRVVVGGFIGSFPCNHDDGTAYEALALSTRGWFERRCASFVITRELRSLERPRCAPRSLRSLRCLLRPPSSRALALRFRQEVFDQRSVHAWWFQRAVVPPHLPARAPGVFRHARCVVGLRPTASGTESRPAHGSAVRSGDGVSRCPRLRRGLRERSSRLLAASTERAPARFLILEPAGRPTRSTGACSPVSRTGARWRSAAAPASGFIPRASAAADHR